MKNKKIKSGTTVNFGGCAHSVLFHSPERGVLMIADRSTGKNGIISFVLGNYRIKKGELFAEYTISYGNTVDELLAASQGAVTVGEAVDMIRGRYYKIPSVPAFVFAEWMLEAQTFSRDKIER